MALSLRFFPVEFMKTLKSDGTSPTDISGPSHEQIARRAYELWEERGRPHGSDEEDWHRAEHELQHQPDAPADTPSAAKEMSA